MSNNLKIWDAVRKPPQEALKAFKRSGGFAGTAIKPMWSIKAMTEQFGPCGEGWGIEKPEFVTHTADKEVLVFCTVAVWHGKPECKVFGVGGDKIIVSQSNGLRADDEGFKKAYTDAITNALKHLGVGADIHMGLWDGSKYAEEEVPVTKTASRETFQRLCTELVALKTWDDYQVWTIKNADTFKTLNSDLLANLQASTKAKEFKFDIADCLTLDDLATWNATNKAAYQTLPPDALDEVATAYIDRKKVLGVLLTKSASENNLNGASPQ